MPIAFPDGSAVPRLPASRCGCGTATSAGSIQMRWQPDTTDLPPTCLGHVGYSVVPWRRNRGYATAALRQLLPLAREIGLPWIDLTTDADNIASQRVIFANGGTLVEHFAKPESYGKPQAAMKFRIHLDK